MSRSAEARTAQVCGCVGSVRRAPVLIVTSLVDVSIAAADMVCGRELSDGGVTVVVGCQMLIESIAIEA